MLQRKSCKTAAGDHEESETAAVKDREEATKYHVISCTTWKTAAKEERSCNMASGDQEESKTAAAKGREEESCK